ncbi:MAG: hypothetical protein Q9192_005731 [Flavoplaca navasiana]
MSDTNDKMTMLYKITNGWVEETHYGIAMAKVAGLPANVIQIAEEVSSTLARNTERRKKKSKTIALVRRRKWILGLREQLKQAKDGNMQGRVLGMWLSKLQDEFVRRMAAIDEEVERLEDEEIQDDGRESVDAEDSPAAEGQNIGHDETYHEDRTIDNDSTSEDADGLVQKMPGAVRVQQGLYEMSGALSMEYKQAIYCLRYEHVYQAGPQLYLDMQATTFSIEFDRVSFEYTRSGTALQFASSDEASVVAAIALLVNLLPWLGDQLPIPYSKPCARKQRVTSSPPSAVVDDDDLAKAQFEYKMALKQAQILRLRHMTRKLEHRSSQQESPKRGDAEQNGAAQWSAPRGPTAPRGAQRRARPGRNRGGRHLGSHQIAHRGHVGENPSRNLEGQKRGWQNDSPRRPYPEHDQTDDLAVAKRQRHVPQDHDVKQEPDEPMEIINANVSIG